MKKFLLFIQILMVSCNSSNKETKQLADENNPSIQVDETKQKEFEGVWLNDEFKFIIKKIDNSTYKVEAIFNTNYEPKSNFEKWQVEKSNALYSLSDDGNEIKIMNGRQLTLRLGDDDILYNTYNGAKWIREK